MIINRAEIKQQAKDALQNNLFSANWLLAIVVIILVSLIGYAVFLLLPFLYYGYKLVFLKTLRSPQGTKIDISDAFKGFSNHAGRNFLVGFMSSLFAFLWSLIFVVPGTILLNVPTLALQRNIVYSHTRWSTIVASTPVYPVWAVILAWIGVLLIVAGVVFSVIKTYSYSMAYYIAIDNPDMKWNDCITRSKELMSGKKWQYFVLELSFIGWNIVGFLCCCVGSLWVIAYEEQTKAAFYEKIRGDYTPEAVYGTSGDSVGAQNYTDNDSN